MLQNMSGTFFHIDFGHFLGNGKKQLGFTRDREPFILSNELNYFLKNFCLIEAKDVTDRQEPAAGESTVIKTKGGSQRGAAAERDNPVDNLGMHVLLDD